MPHDDPELQSTERLKNLVKLTGDIEVDAQANLKGMLVRELKNDTLFGTGALEIYDIEPDQLPRLPAIALVLTGSRTEQRTLGKNANFTREVFIDLVYYNSDVNQKNKSSDIIKKISRIQSVLRRNADLNGYCRMGARTGLVRRIERVILNSEAIVTGFVIPIIIPILYKDRAAGPGL